MNKLNKNDVIIFLGLLATILISRFVSHDWNFTFLGAGTFLAGYFLKNKNGAFLLSFLGLLISDYVIGFHNQMLEVYGCVFFGVFLAQAIRQNNSKWWVASAGSLISAVIFYLVTNATSWWGNALYSQDFSGLIQSYVMAWPFFRNQLIADVGFVTLVVGAYQFFYKGARQQVPHQS